jgi:hypothetical protein
MYSGAKTVLEMKAGNRMGMLYAEHIKDYEYR